MYKSNIVSLISLALAGVATAAPAANVYLPTCNFVNSGTWGAREAAESLREQLANGFDDVYNYTSTEPIILGQVTLHGITTYVTAQGAEYDPEGFDTYGQAANQVQAILDNCDFIHCGTASFDGESVCFIEGTKATTNWSPIISVYGDAI